MSEDDSKELADAGSFGLKFDFHADQDIPTHSFIRMIENVLTEVGENVIAERGSLLGHIKAFITTPHGTLKVNLIDKELGPESLSRISSPVVNKGEMKFMAALVGLSDHEVEEMMEDSLESIRDSLDFDLGEHEHEHHHEH